MMSHIQFSSLFISRVSQLEIFDSLLSLKEVHKMFLTNVYLYIPLIIIRGFIYPE